MTRVIVAREGKAPFAGAFIERNCFVMQEGVEELWVVHPGDNYEPIGKARDFQRDEEAGTISFDIQLKNDFPIEEEHFALYADHLIESRIGDVRHVHEATIRHVAYIPYAGYPASRDASQKTQGT